MFCVLEAAYRDHHSQHAKSRDPVSLVHAYTRPADQEVVGLIVALLSYGGVPTILRNAQRALEPLGKHPSRTLLLPGFRPNLAEFKHRFTTGADLEVVFAWLGSALRKKGSLESYFLEGQRPEGRMADLLSSFVQRLTSEPLPPELSKKREMREAQLKHLLSDPKRGSACKRLNMFLRWMVRPADGIDLGIWKRVQPSQLILPLDTHVLKTVRALHWTRSRQANWKLAEAATARLARYCPEDPVRYDFSLCHLSMEGGKILHYMGTHGAKLERRPFHKKSP